MKSNKRIITVMVAVLALFLVLVIYLTYFTIFQAPKMINKNSNPRIREREMSVLRGSIYDRSGTILAESEQTESGQRRIYPFGSLYAHTIGYSNVNYGKSNLELNFNNYMMKTHSVIDFIVNEQKDEKLLSEGADLWTTLDHGMTKLASEKLSGVNGSVVALNPQTGEVYCIYSNPSFDPNDENLTQEKWSELSQREDTPLYERALKGAYPSGSTFKVITGAAGIRAGYGEYETNDRGKTTVGGRSFRNAGGGSYGHIGMSDAIRVSSNVYFTELSEKIGKDIFKETVEDFYITKDIPFDLESRTGTVDFENMDNAALAEASIGQGTILVSPFNMALVAGAIANNGVLMKPYIVEEASYDNGEVIYSAPTGVLNESIDSNTAYALNTYMQGCVSGGTGTAARVSGITVAGKTGTAETGKGADHAWFIGFAPAENPQIALCVMVEHKSGGGGGVCAPIASRIISYAYKNGIITN